ncbi:MAG: CAP domain-containing protein [Sulfurimonas sp.]
MIWFLVIIIGVTLYLHLPAPDSSDKEPTLIEPEPLNYDFQRSQALHYLNRLRNATGLIPLQREPILETAAQNHARYLIENDQLSHTQIRTDKSFTGVTPADRAIYTGYRSNFVTENISTNNRDYKASIDNLFSAIYHRFAFLDFKIDQIGIGLLQNSTQRSDIAYVYNMGLSSINRLCGGETFQGQGKYIYGICKDKNYKIKASRYTSAVSNVGLRNRKVVVYPYDEQKDVPPAFFDEIPDPLPNHRVSGFPISVSFNTAYFKKIEILSFELYDQKRQKVSNTLLFDHTSDPHGKFKKFEYALFPLERLAWNSKYDVKLRYKANGKKEEKNWSFYTTSFEDKLHTVTPQNNTFTISRNISSVFYLKPSSRTDILDNIHFPSYMYISFIDLNTIRVTATSDAPDHVNLVFGEHSLNLTIE